MFLLTQTQPNASFSPNIQDIYNILSIIGFILSAGITIHTWRKSRECYHISVIDYEVHHSVFQLLIAISNCSSNPLVIHTISCGGIDCELEPKPIRGKPGSFGFEATPRFPLCIEAYGCHYAYLEFVDYPHTSPTPGTNLTLEIHSTRKQVQKTLLLGDKSHYLHTRAQFRAFRDSQQKT